MNGVIAELAKRSGALVDLHAHFLTGDSSWFTQIIEPSLQGASEIVVSCAWCLCIYVTEGAR